jgi:hypothetical protein
MNKFLLSGLLFFPVFAMSMERSPSDATECLEKLNKKRAFLQYTEKRLAVWLEHKRENGVQNLTPNMPIESLIGLSSANRLVIEKTLDLASQKDQLRQEIAGLENHFTNVSTPAQQKEAAESLEWKVRDLERAKERGRNRTQVGYSYVSK